MPSAAVDEIIDVLRAAGERITTAKRALVSELLGSTAHVTAEELIERVQKVHPDVNKSTIYRILHSLEAHGIVEHVHLGHSAAVYHLSGKTHHHLVCESCGRVQEVPEATLAAIARKLRHDFGFSANLRHFAISGHCETCG